ncbi:MAG: ABC-type transport auxiliary lipoprotein family protein [Alphaproteobacteria bacterium]
MNRLILIVLALTGLTGCLGSAPPVPRDHYYRVMVPTPSRAAASQSASIEGASVPGRPGSGVNVVAFPGVLSVAPLEAEGLLRERPLLYSATGSAYEMQQHDYHYWMDPPTRMLQLQLVDYLRASGLVQSVVTPDLRIKTDYEVNGRIKRLERLLGGGPTRVVVEMELSLVARANNDLIVVGTYTAEEIAADDGVESSVLALNQALGQVFERFLTDATWSHTAFLAAPLD